MRYVVSGATGLLGGNVVRELLMHETNEVLALGRNLAKLQDLESKGAKTMRFDITGTEDEFSKLESWGGNSTIWVHCAAAITGASDDELHDVNILGTTKLVAKAEELNISKFVLISSIAIFGLHSPKKLGFQEDDPRNPQSNYGRSKLEQENIVTSSKLDYVIFRPPFIGGPSDVNVLPGFYDRIKSKKMPRISKKGHFAFIDARDIAQLIIKVVDKDISRESFNVQSHSLELNEFIDLIGKTTGLNPPYGKKYPYFLVMTLATILDMFAKMQGISRDRSISRYRIKSLTSNRILDNSKSKNQLDFSPKYSMEQSILDWYETYDAK